MIAKVIILLSSLFIVLSCRQSIMDTPVKQRELNIASAVTEGAVFDQTKMPDLAPVILQQAYEGYQIGILSQPAVQLLNYQYPTLTGEVANWLRFVCPVENIGVPSSQSYSPLVWTGENYSGADLTWSGIITQPNMLYIAVFQNGLPVSVNYKGRWEGTDGDHIFNYNPALDNSTYIFYPTLWNNVFHAMFADTYYEYVKLNSFSTLGRYVVIVTYNQEDYLAPHQRLFNENSYANNTAVVGLNISGSGNSDTQWDSTVIKENIPVPVTNLSGKFIPKTKSVRLDWVCPYHGTGAIHKFRIKRNGAIISDNQWDEGYSDSSVLIRGGNFKGASYSVEIKIEGLGISPASIIQVNRK